MSKKPNFTHLHLHTEYSLLDGANKIQVLAKRIKELGMTSVAMTDHGNLFGAIDFYNTMKKNGIKPIIGMEAYLHNEDELSDKSTRRRFHICLYAKNKTGYKNLMYLSSQSYMKGFYYYPRINKKLLMENCEGIIASSACLQGEINWHLNLQNPRNVKNGAKGFEEAKKIALEYKEIFGDDFYLEIMRHGISDQQFIDKQIVQISIETGIKIIASNDTHYTYKKDADAHEAFMCIAMNKLYDDPNRLRHSVHEFYVKSPEQIQKLYADIPQALENTQEIADKCNVEIDLGNPTPPNFKFTLQKSKELNLNLSEPTTEYSFDNDKVLFDYECKKGLEKRLELVDKNKHEEYRNRLKMEIDIINNMNFPGYMLIVWDFIKYAKVNEIPVGPGRGSAAGSLVAYSLEITDIDPIKYGLIFERFLNPERISMPDIDVDFCQARRQEVINYVVDVYGRNNVAQIITFGKLLAKGVIRDVARVLAMPYSKADAMAKLIPDEIGIKLESAYEKEPKLKELQEVDPTAKRVWKYSLALEGLNRNAGTHAAGVVISNEPLWEKTPLFKPTGLDAIATQYSGKYIEDVDLIKFDFLGLKTLTVVDNALKLIKQRHNIDIDFTKEDMNDSKIYDLISTGHTIGLFQIESSGMQDLNKRLQPNNFEEIISVLALYRPGPMESGMLDDFIERKHGRAKVDYFHEEFEKALKPILEPTYGIIVYQEQVMQIVQTIGGFSLGEADLVRRAMGKKIAEEMNKLKEQFISGASKKGYTEQYTGELFDLIVKFAGYGFNKSHSAAYAMITFYTVYLKAYYPSEFMAALLTSEKDNTDKVVKYVDEVKRLKLDLLPPDINKSYNIFSATKINGKEVVMFGLGALKGAGKSAIDSILLAREDGEFTDLGNFASRIDTSKVNKRVIEALIKSGAFDNFGHTRAAMIEQLEKIVSTAGKISQAKKDIKNSLFQDDKDVIDIKLELDEVPEYDDKQILEFEKNSLGFYVSGHPLDSYRKTLDAIDYTLTSEIDDIADGSVILLIGKVDDIAEKISKKGNKFGIINLLDLHGNIELMLFERKLVELKEDYNLENPIVFKVKVTRDEKFTRLNILKITALKDAKKQKTTIQKIALDTLRVTIPLSEDIDVLYDLFDIISKNQGSRELVVIISSKLHNVEIPSGFRINEKCVDLIKAIPGIYVN